jgi:hypothetical protein
MPSQGLASPYLAKFAPHERQDRVEPELGPSTVPRTAYPAVTSDSPAAAGLSSEVSDFDTEAWMAAQQVRFALDSPVEGDGFELPVPRRDDHDF